MKEIKLYQCEKCYTRYKFKERADQCEKNHKIPIEIVSSRWLSYLQNKMGYPTTINIKMSDGEILTYKR